jgi:DNA-binding transcriptional LysR family regulator
MRGTEFAELEAFAAVATEGSFVKAARARGLSTSTLSQAVRSLEQRLGVRLLDRTTRRVAMTVAGEELLAHVQPALAGLRMAAASVVALRNHPIGSLRLNVSNALAAAMITPIIARFLVANPGVNIEVSIADDIEEIVRGGFDAGIRLGWRVGLGMSSVPISQKLPMLVFASPNYLAKYSTPQTPQDLQRHRCIKLRLADGTFFLWKFEKNGVQIDVSVNGPLVVDNNELLIQAGVDGIGLIYASAQHASFFMEHGRLVPVLQDWSPPAIAYYLYYSEKRKPSAPLRLFIEFLTRAFDQNNTSTALNLTSIDHSLGVNRDGAMI